MEAVRTLLLEDQMFTCGCNFISLGEREPILLDLCLSTTVDGPFIACHASTGVAKDRG